MPSPLETIKIGIQHEDWNLVIEGFKNLTGESIDRIRGLISNEIIMEEIPEEPKKKRGRPAKNVVTPPPQAKKKGRPKKNVEKVPTVTKTVRPPNSTQIKTKSRSDDEEKKEARTQQVTVGKRPQFFTE